MASSKQDGFQLHKAVIQGDVEKVKSLLNGDDKGAVNVNSTDSDGKFPLLLAFESGNEAMFTLLASCDGVDLDQREEQNYGQSVLMMAAELGKVAMLNLLISKGADVNATDDNRESSLRLAVHEDQLKVTEILLRSGACTKSANDPLLLCAESPEMTKLLLDHGVDVDVRSQCDYTPLMEAAIKKKLGTAKVLIQYGANVNEMNKYGMNALMYSISQYDIGCTTNEFPEFLLRNGADPNAMEDIYVENMFATRSTALGQCISQNNLPMARVLIEYGANVNVMVNERLGISTLKLALTLGRKEIANLLIEKGAFINPKVSQKNS